MNYLVPLSLFMLRSKRDDGADERQDLVSYGASCCIELLGFCVALNQELVEHCTRHDHQRKERYNHLTESPCMRLYFRILSYKGELPVVAEGNDKTNNEHCKKLKSRGNLCEGVSSD